MWACFRKPRPYLCEGLSVSAVSITEWNTGLESISAVKVTVLCPSLECIVWEQPGRVGAAGARERTEASFEKWGQWEGAQGWRQGKGEEEAGGAELKKITWSKAEQRKEMERDEKEGKWG